MGNENKVRPKGFRKWIENFWYYYKYHTVVAIVVVLTLSVSITQCATRTKYDYQFVLATASAEMAPTQIEAIKNELLKYCEDVNGDGEVNVNLIDCTFNEVKSVKQTIDSKRQRIQSIVMSEQDILVYFMDKACFEWLDSVIDGGFMEDLGLSTENGKYFSLTETELYKNAKEGFDTTYTWPNELLVSRRIVKDTLIEKDKKVIVSLKKADAFIEKLIKAY